MQNAKNRFPSGSPIYWGSLVLLILLTGVLAPNAAADLVGTVPTAPGDTVFPGLVAPGTDPGTLLASLSTPFTSSLGTDSGTIVSAVYQEAGGTLDFYYQVTNDATSIDSLSTADSFDRQFS